jgi:hypothetical protein
MMRRAAFFAASALPASVEEVYVLWLALSEDAPECHLGVSGTGAPLPRTIVVEFEPPRRLAEPDQAQGEEHR